MSSLYEFFQPSTMFQFTQFPTSHLFIFVLWYFLSFAVTCLLNAKLLPSTGNSCNPTCPLQRSRKQTGPHLTSAHLPILHQPDQLSQWIYILKWESSQSIFFSYCDILLMEVLPNQILQKLLARSCKTTKSTAAAAASSSSSSTRHAERYIRNPYIKQRHVHNRQK